MRARPTHTTSGAAGGLRQIGVQGRRGAKAAPHLTNSEKMDQQEIFVVVVVLVLFLFF